MWKLLVVQYFSFTKKERRGIIALLLFVLFLQLIPYTFSFWIKEETYDHREFESAIAHLNTLQAESTHGFSAEGYGNSEYQRQSGVDNNHLENHLPQGALFFFDPNTASYGEWQKLGVRDKTISTIQRYLQKGGKFKTKEDLGKIWGLRKEEVARLTPYVQIKANRVQEIRYPSTTTPAYAAREYKKTNYAPSEVDINQADTTALMALPGIGSKLSQRIINFRDKLGGFYSVEQVSETFGLPDSTFQKIKPLLRLKDTKPTTININLATVDELKGHPYLRYQLANAIVQYRTQHGNFQQLETLKNIMPITEEVYHKIVPYLTIE